MLLKDLDEACSHIFSGLGIMRLADMEVLRIRQDTPCIGVLTIESS